MDILNASPKESYNRAINKLLDDMQESYDNGDVEENIEKFQKKLDEIASANQRNVNLGKLRYKLYEAQAYLHYFQGNNEEAKRFIREAVRVRGEKYEDATSLEKLIAESNHGKTSDHELDRLGRFVKQQFSGDWEVPLPPTSQEMKEDKEAKQELELNQALPKSLSKVKLNNVDKVQGWLAFLIVSLSIGAIYNLYQFFSELSTFKSLTPDIILTYPNLHTLLVAEEAGFLAAAIAGVILVILILRRKKIARLFGIIFLIGVIAWIGIDYALATNMFANNAAAENAVKSAASSDGRIIIPSALWILYLIFSKRVKQTLTIP